MSENSNKFMWKGKDLETYRQKKDKLADEAVHSIIGNKDIDHLRIELKKLAQNHLSTSDDFPNPMHTFMQEQTKLELTAKDIELFNKTHEIWKKKGMKFVFILFFRSLPLSYMAEKPAHVLDITKLIETQPARRIFETAQFVFDVMEKNWWEHKERGILTALKVRIMHAAMRHIVLTSKIKGNEWNPEWGQPISQEDLIATNQIFSLEFFEGMKILGEDLSDDEKEAWFHTWIKIAEIMGVEPELRADNYKEAWELQHKIYDHLFHDGHEAGGRLIDALVQMMKKFHLHEKLVLVILKRMMADEQHPECFDRLLGPTYGKDYPKLFKVLENEEERKKHEHVLRGEFHDGLKKHHKDLTDNRKKYLKRKKKKGLLEIIIDFVMDLFGINHSHIDFHLERLHEILHAKDGAVLEELEEEAIIASIDVLGHMMITILSQHYRKKRESTFFRIPASLRENWATKA